MKRVLLKLSGEALASRDEIYNAPFVDDVASGLCRAAKAGYELAVVVGAGNIWRGRSGGDMDRITADHMGMLATVINALYLKDALIRQGIDAVVLSSVAMPPFAEGYTPALAKKHLEEGRIVVLGSGLGIPFLSTDTAGAVRAAEIGADMMLMAKNVPFVYTADPRLDPTATILPEVSCTEILAKNLGAIDATAAAFCRSVKMPIRFFGMQTGDDVLSALEGNKDGTLVLAE